jgi:hypothetical protein
MSSLSGMNASGWRGAQLEAAVVPNASASPIRMVTELACTRVARRAVSKVTGREGAVEEPGRKEE